MTPKYRQPHSIRAELYKNFYELELNYALLEHLVEKYHRRERYEGRRK